MSKKNVLIDESLTDISGGVTEEEYYAEYEKYGLIDTEAHLLEGTACDCCNRGKLHFQQYQTGRFGNKEAVYRCSLCSEYTVAVLRK